MAASPAGNFTVAMSRVDVEPEIHALLIQAAHIAQRAAAERLDDRPAALWKERVLDSLLSCSAGVAQNLVVPLAKCEWLILHSRDWLGRLANDGRCSTCALSSTLSC